MGDTPIYDELEAEWNYTDQYRAVCDAHWTVTHPATGQVWYEDDEGNEVFPEPSTAKLSVGEGWIQHPKLDHLEVRDGMVRFKDSDCPVSNVPKKRKFKLFGRNQDCQGTL